jgi:hypothetical protein
MGHSVYFAVQQFASHLNYRAIERNFDMTIRDVANTHIPLLSLAIWDIELQAHTSRFLY